MKKFAMLMVALTMLFALTACGDKTEGNAETEQQTQEETQGQETPAEGETETPETPAEGETETPAADEVQTAEFTGVLEEKKDFMVIVNSEDGSKSYIFNLDEGVTCEAEPGDKVDVTYVGDLEKFDPAGDEKLVATAVVKAQ